MSARRHRIEAAILKRLFSPTRWMTKQVRGVFLKTLRLGSEYGGWTIVVDDALHEAWVVLCGAGEDISFDLALQQIYDCHVVIVDPTPRAIAHFYRVSKGLSTAINNSITDIYDLTNVDFSRLHFLPVAVWTTKALVKFWQPRDRAHVSHSITNLQRTKDYIEVSAETFDDIIKRFKIASADIRLVKLDVEGAAIEIIKWMVLHDFRPKQLLIEFDEMLLPNFHTRRAIKQAVSMLQVHGYELAHFDGRSNCTFYLTSGSDASERSS